jgi:hypothetical protein
MVVTSVRPLTYVMVKTVSKIGSTDPGTLWSIIDISGRHILCASVLLFVIKCNVQVIILQGCSPENRSTRAAGTRLEEVGMNHDGRLFLLLRNGSVALLNAEFKNKQLAEGTCIKSLMLPPRTVWSEVK